MTTKSKMSLYDRNPGLVNWLNWLAGLSMVLIAILDQNRNFVFGIVGWLVLMLILFPKDYKQDWIYDNKVANWLYDWFYSTFSDIGRIAWRHLAIVMVFLFVAGNGLFGKPATYLVLENQFYKRVLPARSVTLHLPVFENAGFFKETNTFAKSGAIFTTADGKNFVADVEVTVSLDGSIKLEQLLWTYGSLAKYRAAYTQGILNEFQRVASGYTLEQIANSSSLLLEDHIGTNMGLAPYGLRWSGVLKVTNVHMTAEEQ